MRAFLVLLAALFLEARSGHAARRHTKGLSVGGALRVHGTKLLPELCMGNTLNRVYHAQKTSYLRSPKSGSVVQWIVRGSPEPKIQVRFLAGPLNQRGCGV